MGGSALSNQETMRLAMAFSMGSSLGRFADLLCGFDVQNGPPAATRAGMLLVSGK